MGSSKWIYSISQREAEAIQSAVRQGHHTVYHTSLTGLPGDESNHRKGEMEGKTSAAPADYGVPFPEYINTQLLNAPLFCHTVSATIGSA